MSLCRARQFANGHALPLSATEIKAWADLSGVTLDPVEFRLIAALDTEYLKSHV